MENRNTEKSKATETMLGKRQKANPLQNQAEGAESPVQADSPAVKEDPSAKVAPGTKITAKDAKAQQSAPDSPEQVESPAGQPKGEKAGQAKETQPKQNAAKEEEKAPAKGAGPLDTNKDEPKYYFKDGLRLVQ